MALVAARAILQSSKFDASLHQIIGNWLNLLLRRGNPSSNPGFDSWLLNPQALYPITNRIQILIHQIELSYKPNNQIIPIKL